MFDYIRERVVTVLLFILHLAVGAVGVGVMASILRYSILIPLQEFSPSEAPRVARWMQHILLETPYFPVQIVIALIWGFQLGRRYRHVVMLWIWTVPAVTIALLILFAPFSPVVVQGVELSKARHFFGWACLPQNHCYEQVGLTLPFYSATAYSLGAFLAKISNPRFTMKHV